MGDEKDLISPSQSTPEEYTFVKLKEYLQLPKEPKPWVIHKLIPVAGIANIFGKPKTGKSFIALQMAEAIASGASEWEGFPIDLNGPVCYLQIDTPREEWSRRAEFIQQRVEGKDIPLYIADMWLVPQFPFNILSDGKKEITWLRAKMNELAPVLVIIDTLREVHNGDEDNSTVMRNVIAEIVGACRPAAILLVSHARKDTIMTQQGDEDMMDAQRGSSYVAGRMDVIMQVTKKRLAYKGRAGQGRENIEQDPETGFIRISRGDDEEMRKKIEAECVRLTDQNPGISVNSLAQLLSAKFDFSISTGTRRIKEWQERLKKEAEKHKGHGSNV